MAGSVGKFFRKELHAPQELVADDTPLAVRLGSRIYELEALTPPKASRDVLIRSGKATASDCNSRYFFSNASGLR